MRYLRYLVAVVLAVSLTGCSFETTYDPAVYWKCGPEGKCNQGCSCIEGRFCVPDDENIAPGDCAWCPAHLADCNNLVPDGCEVNPVVDPDNCGVCGHSCTRDFFCEYAACVDACRPGLTQCGRSCIDTTSNPQNCGECDKPCGSNQVCSRGECEAECAEDLTLCNIRCVDTNSDPANCNECGNLCRIPNAVAQCTDGNCQIRQCIEPFGDCNSNPADGCETDLSADNMHCGSCTNPCNQIIESTCLDATQREYPTGVVSCVLFNCEYETEIEVCEHGCQGGECRGEVCGEGRCDPDENCNNNVCHCGDDPGVVCPANEYCCEGSCVDLQNDAWNCDACGKVCGDNAICAAGKCECDSTHENCDTDWSNGCEADITNDSENCNGCGIICPDNSHCMDSDCHCNDNFDDCDGNWEANGCEANLQWDASNCFTCDNSCGAEGLCDAGSCICKAGFDNCDGGWDNGCEVDVLNNVNNCGWCGNNCVGDLPCEGGQCGVDGVICGGETCSGADTNICCYDIDSSNYFCTDIDGCPGETNGLGCDGPEDCPSDQVCCLNAQNGLIALCGPPPCQLHDLCSSDDQCLENQDGKPFCCAESINEYWIYLCQEWPCD
jgi:hypothetical protein